MSFFVLSYFLKFGKFSNTATYGGYKANRDKTDYGRGKQCGLSGSSKGTRIQGPKSESEQTHKYSPTFSYSTIFKRKAVLIHLICIIKVFTFK